MQPATVREQAALETGFAFGAITILAAWTDTINQPDDVTLERAARVFLELVDWQRSIADQGGGEDAHALTDQIRMAARRFTDKPN